MSHLSNRSILEKADLALADLTAGGGILNDTGSAENLKNFSTGAGFGFVEVTLEPGIRMQARYTRMLLPPSAENGPDIDVDEL